MSGREGLCGADYVENMSNALKNAADKIKRLQVELKCSRNELCLACGKFKEAHHGACDDCRYRHGGEWEADVYE